MLKDLCIQLDGPIDWCGFQRAVRHLVHQAIEPQAVRWACGAADGEHDRGPAPACDLFQGEPTRLARDLPEAPALALPAGFVALAREVLLHDDERRFEHLYGMAWRLAHAGPDRRQALWQDLLDPGRTQLARMAQAVRREMHKMTAFVRFRPVVQAGPPGDSPATHHVAWFEPAHHVVEAVAPFFARRFAQMAWTVLTPRRCVAWHDGVLHLLPGERRENAPAPDAGEALWLAYYASIFNPARLKVDMMRREMPVRFWKNLPEAALIAPLVAHSAQRTGRMLEAPPAPRARRRSRGLASPVRMAAVQVPGDADA